MSDTPHTKLEFLPLPGNALISIEEAEGENPPNVFVVLDHPVGSDKYTQAEGIGLFVQWFMTTQVIPKELRDTLGNMYKAEMKLIREQQAKILRVGDK
jgi:hypothetical protein